MFNVYTISLAYKPKKQLKSTIIRQIIDFNFFIDEKESE
jgi:hypothetical protein